MSTWIYEHTWIVPLVLMFIWIGICWWLLSVMTGGAAFSVVLFLLVSGVTFIWGVFGAFHFVMYLVRKWVLIE